MSAARNQHSTHTKLAPELFHFKKRPRRGGKWQCSFKCTSDFSLAAVMNGLCLFQFPDAKSDTGRRRFSLSFLFLAAPLKQKKLLACYGMVCGFAGIVNIFSKLPPLSLCCCAKFIISVALIQKLTHSHSEREFWVYSSILITE